MNKLWHFIGTLALVCLVIGIIAVGVGFFTGSSPVAIQNHGELTEYLQRLAVNRDILRGMLAPILP